MPDKKVLMVADARFMHGGERLHVNQEFETDEANAADLSCLGMAHRKPGVVATLVETVRGTRYRTRSLVSE